MRITSLAFLLLLMLPPSAQARVEFKEDTGVCNITITGAITSADLPALKSIVAAHRCKGRPIYITLNSPGGDVEAGIQLGKYIRDQRAWTGVSQGASCASSCVLVLLGGVSRSAWGSVGLHRPYSERMNPSTADAAATYKRINGLVSSYLSQMNIPLRLLDEMNAVSPGDVRWISDTEKVSLHIKGRDPIEEDIESSSDAKRRGLSKQEYYRRSTMAEETCWNLPNDGTQGACFEEIMKTGRAPQ